MFQRVNLVPKPSLSSRIRRTAPFILTIGFGAVLLFLVLSSLTLQHRITELDKELAALEADILQSRTLMAAAQTLGKKIAALKEQNQNLMQLVQGLEARKPGKRSYSGVLAAISSSLPPTIRCDAVRIDRDAGQLSGVALQYRDLPNLVKKLHENPLFRSVSLKEIDRNRKNGGPGFVFTISFELASPETLSS